MSEVFLSKQASEVLKELLDKRNNKFGGKDVSESEYKNMEDEIKELKENSFIEITWLPQPYQKENRIFRIQITNKGKNYFDNKRYDNWKYLVPILLSVIAIIISIIK